MFTYKWVDTSLAVVIQQCVAGFPRNEVYLTGDDAAKFRRDYNRAKQKEQSKRCNPKGAIRIISLSHKTLWQSIFRRPLK